MMRILVAAVMIAIGSLILCLGTRQSDRYLREHHRSRGSAVLATITEILGVSLIVAGAVLVPFPASVQLLQ